MGTNMEFGNLSDLKKSLTQEEIFIIHNLSMLCLEESKSPLIRSRNDWGRLQKNYDELAARLNSRDLSSLPEYEFHSKPKGLIIDFVQNEMLHHHSLLFLDTSKYIQFVQKVSPGLAEIICKTSGDAGLVRGFEALEICRATKLRCDIDQTIPGSTNASLHLQEVLWKNLMEKSKVYIRINPYRLIDKKESHTGERAGYFGRPFDTKWLNNLKGEVSAEHGPNISSSLGQEHRVQYLFSSIKSRNNQREIEFSCEELPELQSQDFISTRFIHGIYLPKEERFNHLDGAIHFYEHDNYSERLTLHLKKRFKAYKKSKIFRIDEKVDLKEFELLLATFYRWNPIAPEYFESSS